MSSPTFDIWTSDSGPCTMSYFQCGLQTLVQEYCEWSPLGGYTIESTRIGAGLSDWKSYLTPLATPPTAGVFFKGAGRWCGFIDNDRIASVPSSMLYSMAERLRIRSVGVALDDLQLANAHNRPYGSVFHYFDGTRGEVRKRDLMLVKDLGKWEFSESGAPLPFERLDDYQNPKKALRLPRETLLHYLSALGITVQDMSRSELVACIGIRMELRKSNADEVTSGLVQTLLRSLPSGFGRVTCRILRLNRDDETRK